LGFYGLKDPFLMEIFTNKIVKDIEISKSQGLKAKIQSVFLSTPSELISKPLVKYIEDFSNGSA